MVGVSGKENVRRVGAERKLSLLVLLTSGLLLACLKVRIFFIAVLALVGIGSVVFLMLHPVSAVCMLTFLAYGNVSGAFLPGVFSLLLILAFIAWTVRAFLSSDLTISATSVDLTLVIYVSTLLISMVFSRLPEVGGPDLLLVGKALILYALLVNIVRTEKAALQVSGALVVGAALSGLMGLWASSHEKMQVLLGAVYRASGLTGNPNELAIVMVTAVPISAYMLGAVKSRFGKFFFAIVTLLLVGANLVTLSRTGLVAMLVVMFLIAFRERRRNWVKLLVAAFFIVLPLLITPEFWQRLAGSGYALVDYSAYLRTGAMKAGLRMFAENPVTGVGLGTYFVKSTEYGDLLYPLVAHNMFIHVLAESGILGLTAMLFLMGSSLRAMEFAERTTVQGSPLFYLARAYRFSYLAFLLCGLSGSIQNNQSFWFMPAASVFLSHVARKQASNSVENF